MAETPPHANPDPTAPRRSSIGRRILFFAPFLVFVVLSVLLGLRLLERAQPADDPRFESTRPAPKLDLPRLFGEGRVTRDDLTKTGGVVVVNFWFSTCPPCVIEHPVLMRLSQVEDVTVIGVAYQEDPALSRRFLDRLGNPFTRTGVDANGRAAVSWGVRGFPETFILNAKGEIVYKHTGPLLADDIERVLLPALAAARKP